MVGGFRIGRWFGFRIRIDYSWFIVFALVTWTFASWEFPYRLPGLSASAYTVMGVAGALLLFLSVLLHELAHSVVARARGIPVEGITLFIFGGIAEMRMEARRPLDEFVLTAAGPVCSLVLAAAFLGLSRLAGLASLPAPATLGGTLAVLNLVLAVFNMIPAFPLDGGRIFRSLVWRVTGDLNLATRYATVVGRGFGLLLVAYGLLLFLTGRRLVGLWGILLGWFLTSAATTAARQNELRHVLSGVSVGGVMNRSPRFVPADLSTAEFADRYLLRSSAGAYPVVGAGNLVGLVTVSDVTGLPASRRAVTPVFEIMRPIDEVPRVDAGALLLDVLVRLQAQKEDRAIVVSDGELRGVLAVQDVARWVDRVRELGLSAAADDADA